MSRDSSAEDCSSGAGVLQTTVFQRWEPAECWACCWAEQAAGRDRATTTGPAKLAHHAPYLAQKRARCEAGRPDAKRRSRALAFATRRWYLIHNMIV